MSGKTKYDYPSHPAVDWATVQRKSGERTTVETTCPICGRKFRDRASQVSYRIRKGTYTGRCYKDRLFFIERKDRLPRPNHPAVDWNNKKIVNTGKQRLTKVAVTCPICKEVRYCHPGSTAAHVRNNNFTGECIRCSKNAKKREWKVLSPGRKIDPNKGYIRLGKLAIPEEYIWLYDAMVTKKRHNFVTEHRFVMAKKLHRALHSNELVDHMDGNKLNNEPDNLRLYIRGKNQPGETTGYGTYYDEWQAALTHIKLLESRLSKYEGIVP